MKRSDTEKLKLRNEYELYLLNFISQKMLEVARVIKRYGFILNTWSEDAMFREIEDGEYVKYEDYEKLEKENIELVQKLQQLESVEVDNICGGDK